MIKIKNWSSYQSYKDRRPPWIRFHRTILDNYDFQSMTAESRSLLPMLWLLACEHCDPKSGIIDLDTNKIAFRLRITNNEVSKSLIELESAGFIDCNETVTKPLQNSIDPVTTETETETETKAETDKDLSTNVDFVSEIFDFWIVTMSKNTSSTKLTSKRKKAINARIKDGYTIEQIKDAILGCSNDLFSMGQNDRNKPFNDIELICRTGEKLESFLSNVSQPKFTAAEQKTYNTLANLELS